MNSEAASETQYEDSKPHFTKYRKDAKIMLRRKLLSVLLALALVVSMDVPALAVSGTWGGINYTLSAYLNADGSSVTMTIHNASAEVTAEGRGLIYVLIDDANYYGRWSSATDDISATASVSNLVYDNEGYYKSGAIIRVEGKGYIGTNYVDRITRSE